MKLLAFVGADSHGKAFLAAVALLSDETTESFQWALYRFEESIEGWQTLGESVFSDGDPAMAQAIRTQWHWMKHLRCTWHLAKDFKSKFGVHDQQEAMQR